MTNTYPKSVLDTVCMIVWYANVRVAEDAERAGLEFALSNTVTVPTREQQYVLDLQQKVIDATAVLMQGGYMTPLLEITNTDHRPGPEQVKRPVETVDFPLDVQQEITFLAWQAHTLATRRLRNSGVRSLRKRHQVTNPTREQEAAFNLKEMVSQRIHILVEARAMRPLLEGSGVEIAALSQDEKGDWGSTVLHRL